MNKTIEREVHGLIKMSIGQLRARYAEVFGDATRAGNKVWLTKRIAWRLQAMAEGDLPERARLRAAELANDADLRVVTPKPPPALAQQSRSTPERLATPDRRLPPIGTVVTRTYKGDVLQVTVRADGLEFRGRMYRSLSAVAKAATGSHCNGYAFFGLAGKGGAR